MAAICRRVAKRKTKTLERADFIEKMEEKSEKGQKQRHRAQTHNLSQWYIRALATVSVAIIHRALPTN